MATKITDTMTSERLLFDENGSLFRQVSIHWNNFNKVKKEINKKEYNFIIYKENEKEECLGRNFERNYMGGYVFFLPHESYTNYYYGKNTNGKPYGIEELFKYNKCALSGMTEQTKEEIEELILSNENTKDFIYTFRAIDYSSYGYAKKILDIYKVWKVHGTKTEMLIKLGFNNLALSKQIYKYNNKEFINKLVELSKSGSYTKSLSYYDILAYTKNLNKDIYRMTRSEEMTKYFTKQGEDNFYYNYSLYKDYIKMLKQTNHDINDDYWKFPKDIREFHNKVLNEVKAIQIAKEKEKNEQYNNKFKEIIKDNHKEYIDKYNVYICDNMEDMVVQAEELHQCLIACAYYKKVANKECLLLFIREQNTPIATCQIDYHKKILQFYGNEQDRNNCLPNEDVKNIVSNYIKNLKLKKCINY